MPTLPALATADTAQRDTWLGEHRHRYLWVFRSPWSRRARFSVTHTVMALPPRTTTLSRWNGHPLAAA